MTATVEEKGLTIDRALLSAMLRQRARSLVMAGVAAFVVFATYGLFFASQSFTSTVSISAQQPTASGAAALLGLGGLAPGQRRYMGIIRSRLLAEKVERKLEGENPAFSVKGLYDLTTEKAIEKIEERCVKANDNVTDGLLYVTVTLDGPARLAADPSGRRQRVKMLSARIANEYAAALRDYYINSDNDKEAVLLRGAEQELARARQDYEQAVGRLSRFVRSNPSPRTAASMSMDSSGSSASSNQLYSLYLEFGKAEAELRGARAGREAQSRLTEEQLQNLSSIPGEDPLLAAARSAYTKAKENLEQLKSVWGDDAPVVLRAKQVLKIAEARLAKETEGVKGGRTSDRVLSAAEIEALQAKRDTLFREIEEGESNFRQGRDLSTAFVELRDKLIVQLEALKATASKAAELRIQTAAAQSRMVVVDEARPPEYGTPGILVLTALSLIGALGVVFTWILFEYRTRSRRSAAIVRA